MIGRYRKIMFGAGALVIAACSSALPEATDGTQPIIPLTTPDGAITDASQSGDSEASTAHDGGLDGGGDAEAGPPVYEAGPSLCNPSMTLSGDTLLSASTASEDRFGAITPDELTIAWMVPTAGDGTVHVADRATAGDPFSAAQTLPGVAAVDELALSPEGLRVTAVAADRRSFLLFERASKGDAFAAVSADAFDALLAALGPAEKLGDPVVGFGEQVLVYSVFGTADTATVRLATRLSTGSPWSVGGKLDYPELRAQGTQRRRPTGVGSDFATLFYWDEVDATQKIAQMKGTIGFFSVHTLGAHRFAQPNAACTRVYYSFAGAAGLDLGSANAN